MKAHVSLFVETITAPPDESSIANLQQPGNWSVSWAFTINEIRFLETSISQRSFGDQDEYFMGNSRAT